MLLEFGVGDFGLVFDGGCGKQGRGVLLCLELGLRRGFGLLGLLSPIRRVE